LFDKCRLRITRMKQGSNKNGFILYTIYDRNVIKLMPGRDLAEDMPGKRLYLSPEDFRTQFTSQ
jgi:hypothetical protein